MGKETKTFMVISSVMLVIQKIYEEIQILIQFLAIREVHKICKEIILPSASSAFYHIFPKYKCINLFKDEMLHRVVIFALILYLSCYWAFQHFHMIS